MSILTLNQNNAIIITMKKLLLSICLFSSLSLGETLISTNTNAFHICVAPKMIFSIDVPCHIKTISYSDNMQGNISKGSPHTAFFMALGHSGLAPADIPFSFGDQKKPSVVHIGGSKSTSASAVVACKSQSFSFEMTLRDTCTDNHFLVITPKPLSKAKFDGQAIINMASGMMREILKGQVPFGFRAKPIHVVKTNVMGNPYVTLNLTKAYVGGNFIAFSGTISNSNPVVPAYINIPTFMQKGWVLLYIDSPRFRTNTVLEPKETDYIYVVALNNLTGIEPTR